MTRVTEQIPLFPGLDAVVHDGGSAPKPPASSSLLRATLAPPAASPAPAPADPPVPAPVEALRALDAVLAASGVPVVPDPLPPARPRLVATMIAEQRAEEQRALAAARARTILRQVDAGPEHYAVTEQLAGLRLADDRSWLELTLDACDAEDAPLLAVLVSARPTGGISRARYRIFYALRSLTKYSLDEIAKVFGCAQRTVSHGAMKHGNRLAVEALGLDAQEAREVAVDRAREMLGLPKAAKADPSPTPPPSAVCAIPSGPCPASPATSLEEPERWIERDGDPPPLDEGELPARARSA